jgi:hypothetical protein
MAPLGPYSKVPVSALLDEVASARALDRDAVFVHFDLWHDEPRVYLTSPALQQLDPEDAGYAVALNRLNELNLRHRFVKWTVTDGVLFAVHDLLGTTLQAGELINAVMSIAGAVHNACEELEDVTGGLRYDEIIADVELSDVEDDF